MDYFAERDPQETICREFVSLYAAVLSVINQHWGGAELAERYERTSAKRGVGQEVEVIWRRFHPVTKSVLYTFNE